MLKTGLLVILFGAGLALAWQISGTLLLLFSGLLLAAVLDAAVGGLGRILPIGRPWRLLLVSFLAIMAIAALLGFGGYNIWRQAGDLWDVVIESLENLGERLESWGIPLQNGFLDDFDLGEWRPDPETLFGHAGTAFGMTFTLLSNALIIALLGVFVAIDPPGYREGLLALAAPRRRHRMRAVLDKTGATLKWWLVGQLAMMVLIGVSTTILLLVAGIDYAILLGLITGLLNFIPFLGPILAGVPLVLALIPEGMTTLLWVMAAFLALQWIEGYLINPFIQHKVVHIAPALGLSFLMVMAALFGAIGVALAIPLLAVIRVLVIELYVKDTLGDHDQQI